MQPGTKLVDRSWMRQAVEEGKKKGELIKKRKSLGRSQRRAEELYQDQLEKSNSGEFSGYDEQGRKVFKLAEDTTAVLTSENKSGRKQYSVQATQTVQQLASPQINPIPKGAYKVTNPDGTVVYRVHGKMAGGLMYVNDYYAQPTRVIEVNGQGQTQSYDKIGERTLKYKPSQQGVPVFDGISGVPVSDGSSSPITSNSPSLWQKGKDLLDSANLKVSEQLMKIKGKSFTVGEYGVNVQEDYLIGGTKQVTDRWIESERAASQARYELNALEGQQGFRAAANRARNKYILFATTKISPVVLGFEEGALDRVREKPVSVVADVALLAAGSTTVSGAKYGFVKLAGKLPILQKSYTALSVTGKAMNVALLGSYGFSVGHNIGSTPGGAYEKSVTAGNEAVRAASYAVGLKIGAHLTKPIEYQTTFEKNLQKLPAERQANVRAELKSLKTKLKQIRSGSLKKPTDVDWQNVERLRKDGAAKIVKSFMQAHKQEVVIGGSVSSRTQISVSGRKQLSLPHDLDAYTNNPDLAKQLALQLKSGGVNAHLRGQKIYIDGMGKAIEFHALTQTGSMHSNYKLKLPLKETVETVKNPLKPFSLATKSTPQGIKVVDIQYQAARKLYGGFEVNVDKLGRAYMYRYTKDIPHFKQMVGATSGQTQDIQASNWLNLGTKGQASLPTITSSTKPQVIKNTPTSTTYSYYNSIITNNIYAPLIHFHSKPTYTLYDPSYVIPTAIGFKAPSMPYTEQRNNRYDPIPPSPEKPFRPITPNTIEPSAPIPDEPYPNVPSPPTQHFPYSPPSNTPYIEQPKSRSRFFTQPVIPQIKIKPTIKRSGTTKSKNVPFSPKYFASIEAVEFGIKGKASKWSIATGLGLRPMR